MGIEPHSFHQKSKKKSEPSALDEDYQTSRVLHPFYQEASIVKEVEKTYVVKVDLRLEAQAPRNSGLTFRPTLPRIGQPPYSSP